MDVVIYLNIAMFKDTMKTTNYHFPKAKPASNYVKMHEHQSFRGDMVVQAGLDVVNETNLLGLTVQFMNLQCSHLQG